MNEEPVTEETHRCGWLVETGEHPGDCYPDEETGWCGLCEMFAENGGTAVVECGAEVTELPNGWECAAGHSHFHDAEYFDDEELAGIAAAHLPLPANARTMDGKPVL